VEEKQSRNLICMTGFCSNKLPNWEVVVDLPITNKSSDTIGRGVV
jgi:hypothetical protein